MNKVEKFITETWKDTVIEQREDEDTLLGLPFPFTWGIWRPITFA